MKIIRGYVCNGTLGFEGLEGVEIEDCGLEGYLVSDLGQISGSVIVECADGKHRATINMEDRHGNLLWPIICQECGYVDFTLGKFDDLCDECR